MEIGELIWIFVIIFFLYRIFFAPSKQKKREYDEDPEAARKIEMERARRREEMADEMRPVYVEKPQPEKRHYVPPSSREPSKFASYTGTDFIDTTTYRSEADKALTYVSLQSPGLREEDKQTSNRFQFLFDFDEIRKGIIVSEVLGKPKALRR